MAAAPSPQAPTLSQLAAWTTLTLLVLVALQQALRLPAAWGVEDWLGWNDAAALAAAVQGWCRRPQGLVPAAAYLLLDQMLFMPLYAVLAWRSAQALRQALAPGQARRGQWLCRLLRPGLAVLLAALLLADSTENLAGLSNLGQPAAGLLLAVAGSLATAGALLPLRRRRAAAACAALLLVLAVVLGWGASARCGAATDPTPAFALAHAAKQALAGALLLLLAAAAAGWWLAVEFDPVAQAAAHDERVALRQLVLGVVGRSRYVLLVLLVFGVLTLGLDQCRDVMLALADLSSLTPAQWLLRVPVLLMGPLAAAALAHSCWLWARLAGMVQRPGLVTPPDADVVRAAGRFARGWARALATVPLLMLGLLVALTLGDLALAVPAAAGSGGVPTLRLAVSAAVLCSFALGALLIAQVLLRLRVRRQRSDPASYLNREPDVWALLWFHAQVLHAPDEPTPALPLRLLAACTRPWLLPLLALLGMLALRLALLVDAAAWAPSPPTLVLLMLALTWWLGVLGLLSLWEQRQSLPWVLLPVALVGLWSVAGLNDNHALSWPQALELGALADQSRQSLLWLGLACAASWWAAVAQPDHWRRVTRLQRRWPLLLAAWAVALAGLWAADRASSRLAAPGLGGEPGRGPAQAPPALAVAFRQWLDERQAQGLAPGPLYLVAAEGGGIRAAYWTAQVLAALDTRQPGFAQRTLLLSGVSGGSMGIAVHRACVRSGVQPVSACIDQGFDRLDALSPLLGGLFFEDLLARALPLSRSRWGCTQPGCAHLDRAASFERAWMQTFPGLASPLQAPHGGEPLMLFNSTWVETGNRTVASSWPLARGAFPAAVPLRGCLVADTRLITAAHTSARFPGTNPLAGVEPLDPRQADADCRSGGHLIDGGYFDNSGLASVLDALRVLQPLLAGSGWQPQVVVIRNGRRPPHCEAVDGGHPLPRCVLPAPVALTDPRTLDIASDRRRLDLYADMLGPLLAVLNVSGVGAHGRDSAGALRAMLGEVGQGCSTSRVQLVDQLDDGSLVPLGWYLSPAARLSLRRQVADRVPGACPPAAIGAP